MTGIDDGPNEAPPSTLHGRILAELEGRIVSGEWPPGHRIPIESELTESYGCSRMTVNKVLTQLVQSGLIERRRKAGSFVRRPYSRSVVLEIKDIKAEILEQGLDYGYEILSCRRRSAKAADRVWLGPSIEGQVLSVVCRHLAENRPFCLEDRIINLTAVPEAAIERFDKLAPGAWLLEKVPWTAAEHRIRAEAAKQEVARQLRIQAGSACLVIQRRTSWRESPITFVRLTYPGEAHELVARLLPSQGAFPQVGTMTTSHGEAREEERGQPGGPLLMSAVHRGRARGIHGG